MLVESRNDYACSAESVDPARVDALEQELTLLAGHLNAGNYRFLKLLAKFDQCGGHLLVGMASCAHWLSWRCGIGLIAARERVRVARALEELPMISDSMRRGVLSYCKVRALTRVATRENEETLLGLAEAGTVQHVEKVVRTYRGVARSDENARNAERYLQTYVDHDGTVVIRARLAPEQGAQFLNALRAASAVLHEAEGDSRESSAGPDHPVDPHGARNADALAWMAESFLTGGGRAGAVGAERALVTIHVDESVLRDARQAGRCEIEDHTTIPPESARRVLCDASVLRVAESANGTPMDVGRKTRAIPTALLRALQLRDKQCQYPGCTNSRFVDAHHIVHWVDGGATSLGNLVLLCRRHHRFVHEYGYAIEKTEGGFEFVRPDGRPVSRVPRLPEMEAERGWAELARQNSEGKGGVKINARTADSGWMGEFLDCDWVLRRLLAFDEQARIEAEVARGCAG